LSELTYQSDLTWRLHRPRRSSHQTAGSDAIEKYDYWIFAATVKNVFFRKGKSAVLNLCANGERIRLILLAYTRSARIFSPQTKIELEKVLLYANPCLASLLHHLWED
jgi:hypothetical protein